MNFFLSINETDCFLLQSVEWKIPRFLSWIIFHLKYTCKHFLSGWQVSYVVWTGFWTLHVNIVKNIVKKWLQHETCHLKPYVALAKSTSNSRSNSVRSYRVVRRLSIHPPESLVMSWYTMFVLAWEKSTSTLHDGCLSVFCFTFP